MILFTCEDINVDERKQKVKEKRGRLDEFEAVSLPLRPRLPRAAGFEVYS